MRAVRLEARFFARRRLSGTQSVSRSRRLQVYAVGEENSGTPVRQKAPLLTRRQACVCCGAYGLGTALLVSRGGLGSLPQYRSFFADVMATEMAAYEAGIADRKSRLLSSLEGVVLELGMGTGPNLPYYPRSRVRRVVACEPNEFMLPYATRAAAAAGVPLEVLGGNPSAEEIPMAAASVDCVVCTLVLCSVRDPAAALREAARVLRPGGRFYFVEHVAADWREQPALAAAQLLLDPLQRISADGCHLTRHTGELLEDLSGPSSAAPFARVELERFSATGAQLIAPHIAGVAFAKD